MYDFLVEFDLKDEIYTLCIELSDGIKFSHNYGFQSIRWKWNATQQIAKNVVGSKTNFCI